MNNGRIFEDLCAALRDFGEKYFTIEYMYSEFDKDDEERDEEHGELIDAFALELMRYFEAAYSDGN